MRNLNVANPYAGTRYLSVGFDVGADFSRMSVMLPNGSLVGRPFKVIHSDPSSREKLPDAYPLASDMLTAPKDEIVRIILGTVCFGETYALAKYDAICAAGDAAVFERA